MLNTTVFVVAEAANVGNGIFVTVSILVLLAALKHFAWGPLTDIFAKRAEQIANDLDSAEKDRIEAEKLHAERQTSLNNSKSEAMTIVKNAKDAAEQTQKNMLQSTNEEIVQLKQKAHESLEADKENAFVSVKNDVADLSLQIASKILQKELDTESHAALIDSYIEGLDK